MTDFFYLIEEEWTYHLSNIIILTIFSLYGTFSTIKKSIALEIFRLIEKQKEKITKEQEKYIKERERKKFIKEFTKAFLGLLLLYIIYVLYITGILIPE